MNVTKVFDNRLLLQLIKSTDIPNSLDVYLIVFDIKSPTKIGYNITSKAVSVYSAGQYNLIGLQIASNLLEDSGVYFETHALADEHEITYQMSDFISDHFKTYFLDRV